MAHATRGHRSGTYEIEEIVKVDKQGLAIVFRHAAAYQPQEIRLGVEHSPAAEQMLQVMVDSIKTGTNGDADSGCGKRCHRNGSQGRLHRILHRPA